MSAAVIIRCATLTDSEAVAALLTELGYPTNTAKATDSLRSALADPGQQLLVAETATGVVGLAAVTTLFYFHTGQRIARLSSLVVSEAMRGQRVGQVLLTAAEHWAMAQGCQQLELSSSTTRERAHAFYVRAGYQPSAYRFVKRLAT